MSAPIGKRAPEAFPYGGDRDANGHTLAARFESLSKADWADAYADLYRQCFGETTSAEQIMFDAERRTKLAAYARKAYARAHPVIGHIVVVTGRPDGGGDEYSVTYSETARRPHDALESACKRARATGMVVYSAAAETVRK